MISVDGTALHGSDTVVDKARLIQGIRVNRHCNIVLFRKVQARIDSARGGPPIFVQLETTGSRQEAVLKYAGITGVTLSRETKIERQMIRGLEHHFEMGRGRCASRGRSSSGGACAATKHRGHTTGNRILNLLRANPVNMRIDTTGSQNQLFTSNHICGSPNNHVWIHALHHVWISSLSNTNDTVPLDTNVGLEDTRDRIHNECIGNDRIQSICRVDTRGLTHSFSQGFTSSKFTFVAVFGQIIFDSNLEIGVSQHHTISCGGTVHIGIGAAFNDKGSSLGNLCCGSMLEVSSSNPGHDLIHTIFTGNTIGQSVARDDTFLASNFHQGDCLGLTRFKSNRSPTRNIETFANGDLAVEFQGLVGFHKGVVRSDLDGPISRVGDAHFHQRRPCIQSDRLAFLDDYFSRIKVLVFHLDKLIEGRTGQEGSFQSQIHVTVQGRNGRVDSEKLGAVGKSRFDLDVFN
mmetsp:Transcript_21868/g.61967  ORF Transcript_21868/g.61967 Transcript_21868/m.61967 type:complete len:462 (-) Transcript_21868:448-1833(-)